MKICINCHKLETDTVNGRLRKFQYLGLDDAGMARYSCEECDPKMEIAAIGDSETRDWVDGVEG